MQEKLVTHPGIVKSVEQGKAEVTVITKSACASCEVKSSCAIGDTKAKIIEVDLAPGEKYEAGQNVVVEMKQSIGSWAVLLGYFFPFLVVLIGLIIFVSLGMDEGISGLLSLSLAVLYYLILYTFRGRLKKKFTYHIQA